MRNQLASYLDKTIYFLLVFFAFATPLFFLPITSEFFEFNKQIFLYGAVVVLLLLWGARMIAEEQVRIVRTPLDLPIILFLAFVLFSSLLSQDQFVSLAGPYSRYHHGFSSILAYVLLYFIAASNLTEKRKIVGVLAALVTGTAISALISILSAFGIYLLPFPWTQNKSFTTLGNPNDLAVLEVLTLPLALGLYLWAKDTLGRIFGLVSFGAIIVSFALVNLLGAWIGLGLSVLVILAYLSRGEAQTFNLRLLLPATLLILGIILVFLPFVRQSEPQKEPILPTWTSWSVATSAIGTSPALGSGPGTFFYDFTRFKPVALNNTDLWDLRFDRPSADFFQILATLGILGTVSYLFFLVKGGLLTLRIFQKTKLSENPIEGSTICTFIIFAFGIFLFPTSTASFVLFVLVLAAMVNLAKDLGTGNVSEVILKIVALAKGGLTQVPAYEGERRENSAILPYFVFVPSLLISLAVAFLVFQVYSAEVYYQKALLALGQNQGGTAFDNLRLAIQKNPYRDVYHRVASATSLAIAQALSQRGQELSEQDRRDLSQIVTIAINEGKITTSYQQKSQAGTSSGNVLNWENLAVVYRSLVPAVGGADIHAINTFVQAINLDPANARLRESLGLFLVSQNRKDEAQRLFEEAVTVKPNYASARYNLARVLREKGGNEEKVVAHLEAVLLNLSENDSQRGQIQKELEEARKKLEEKRAQTPQLPPGQATPPAQPTTPAARP